jgi:hypothetical protein
MRNKKITQKEITKTLEDVKLNIENMKKTFSKNQISAIIHIPLYGILTFFNTDLGRYEILDQAQYEMKLDEIKRGEAAILNLTQNKQEVLNKHLAIQKEKNDKKIPSYIR